jgi:hypothetical protein
MQFAKKYMRSIINGLTLDDLCELLSDYTYLSWAHTGSEYVKLSLRDSLLQVGIKKCNPKITPHRVNTSKDKIQTKIQELKLKQRYHKKQKLTPNLF